MRLSSELERMVSNQKRMQSFQTQYSFQYVLESERMYIGRYNQLFLISQSERFEYDRQCKSPLNFSRPAKIRRVGGHGVALQGAEVSAGDSLLPQLDVD